MNPFRSIHRILKGISRRSFSMSVIIWKGLLSEGFFVPGLSKRLRSYD